MGFSTELLAAGEDVWAAQLEHPFVRELAAGTLDPGIFERWLRQDYRYLLDYARVFAIAGTRADDEETMTHLVGVAHSILRDEMDLHRELAADYGLSPTDLESVEKAPTCVAYTNYLLRTAYEDSLAEISAAIYPCGRGYLDVAEHMATLADGDHRYTPFIEKYTGEAFREAVTWMEIFVDDCAERYPDRRADMHKAFLTSARLEHAFWEMAYAGEGWDV